MFLGQIHKLSGKPASIWNADVKYLLWTGSCKGCASSGVLFESKDIRNGSERNFLLKEHCTVEFRQVFEWWQGVELSKKGCDRCGAVSNWWWWCFALKLLTLNNIIIKIPSFQTKRCFKTLSRCQMWFCTFISCLEKCKERFNRGNCIWKNKNWVLSTFKWLLWDSLFFLVITALHVLQQLIFCQRTQFKRQV